MLEHRCGWSSVCVPDGDAVNVYPFACRTWTCDACAGLRQAQLRALGRAGNPTTFITLTSRTGSCPTADEAAQQLARAWRLIRRRAKHQGLAARIPFLAVFERTRQGWPHLHILCRAPFIAQTWLSDVMRELTGSPIVDIRRVKNEQHAAAYVAKYISKQPERWEGVKRYWTSKDWAPDFRPSKPVHDAAGQRGHLISEESTQVKKRFLACGWLATDIYPGAYRFTPTAAARLPYWLLTATYPNMRAPPRAGEDDDNQIYL